MTTFWFGAAALALLAIAFFFVPLWMVKQRDGRWSISGLVSGILVVPIAAFIYISVTTWQPEPESQIPPEQAAMVAQLAERMASNPNDVDGWNLLGRSYMVLGQYVLAQQAYTEAWNRTPSPDNELKLALGEALILSDRASLSGEAGGLIEDVLNAEPNNQKALWYGGLVAMELGREDAACARWSALLATNPPEDISGVLQRQIGALGCGAGAASAAAVADGPRIELRVSVAPELPMTAVGPQAALFVFARAPGGGPPVAVIRQSVNTVPGSFTLSDANSMLPGRSLADFPELALVARLSASGQPIEQSGDLFAEATYRQGDQGPVELIIDQVVP
jgi:cytochrome c-type biogenesis protein CcmH